jgi:predicted transcriptional regulator
MPLALKEHPPALEVVDQQTEPTPTKSSCRERIEKALTEAGAPLSQKQIRNVVRARASDVGQALADLVAGGRVIKSADGYQLTSPQA